MNFSFELLRGIAYLAWSVWLLKSDESLVTDMSGNITMVSPRRSIRLCPMIHGMGNTPEISVWISLQLEPSVVDREPDNWIN